MFSFFSIILMAGALQTVSSLSNICYGYWGTWSVYRNGNGKFTVTDIDSSLFTHLAYSFFGIDAQGNMNLLDSNLDINQGIESLGVDWEFPAQNGGVAADYNNYILLLQQLKNAFQAHGWLLVTAVSASESSITTSYNVPAMNRIVDFLNVMAYDMHGSWESKTGVNAPLFAQKTDAPGNANNVNSAMRAWVSHGATPGKLVLGLRAYGNTFALADANQAGTGAPATGAGAAGPYTSQAGPLDYLEICEAQKNNPQAWHITDVNDYYVYANNAKLWDGYDNAATMKRKGAFAKSLGLAGVMFWTVDYEDHNRICGPKNSLIGAALAGYKG